MTTRLYYGDCYLSRFDATIAETDSTRLRVLLDRTAFYPTSGGQPHDTGMIAGIAVTDVADEDDRVAHTLAAPLPEAITSVACEIGWQRRWDHMQQHTGQHLLSAVLHELFEIPTVSFHMGADYATIDVAAPPLDPARLGQTIERANAIVHENRPVTIGYEDARSAEGLRKASERTGVLRIVSIADLDRTACGGTHVRATGEIGPILIRNLEKIRGNTRIEFVCGMRAIRRARADFDLLSQISRLYSSAIDECAAVAAQQIAKVKDADKAFKRVADELWRYKGRELHANTAPGADGIRRHTREGPLGDEASGLARSFTAGPKSAFLAISMDPAALLLACSEDSGLNAGAILKPALTAAGGRGGGSATMAQGSVPKAGTLAAVVAALGFAE